MGIADLLFGGGDERAEKSMELENDRGKGAARASIFGRFVQGTFRKGSYPNDTFGKYKKGKDMGKK